MFPPAGVALLCAACGQEEYQRYTSEMLVEMDIKSVKQST